MEMGYSANVSLAVVVLLIVLVAALIEILRNRKKEKPVVVIDTKNDTNLNETLAEIEAAETFKDLQMAVREHGYDYSIKCVSDLQSDGGINYFGRIICPNGLTTFSQTYDNEGDALVSTKIVVRNLIFGGLINMEEEK